MNQTFKQSLPLSFNEEVANSVTHAIGALAMLILLPISASYACKPMTSRQLLESPSLLLVFF